MGKAISVETSALIASALERGISHDAARPDVHEWMQSRKANKGTKPMTKQRCEWHDMPTPCGECAAHMTSTPILQHVTTSTTATVRQPEPTRTDEIPVVHYVIKDILDRAETGRRKYGVLLQPSNGRDQLTDAYQEALDLACYLKAELLKRGKV